MQVRRRQVLSVPATALPAPDHGGRQARLQDGDARLADQQRLAHAAPRVQLAQDGLQVPAGLALLALRQPCRRLKTTGFFFDIALLVGSWCVDTLAAQGEVGGDTSARNSKRQRRCRPAHALRPKQGQAMHDSERMYAPPLAAAGSRMPMIATSMSEFHSSSPHARLPKAWQRSVRGQATQPAVTVPSHPGTQQPHYTLHSAWL